MSKKKSSTRQLTALAVAIATATKPKQQQSQIVDEQPEAEPASYRLSRLGRRVLSAALDDIVRNPGTNLTGEFKLKVKQTADIVASCDGDLIEACDMLSDNLGTTAAGPKIMSLLNSVQKQVLFRVGVLERAANRPTLGDETTPTFDRRNEVRVPPNGVHPEPVPTQDEVWMAAEEINVYLNALYDTYAPSIDLQNPNGAGIPYMFEAQFDDLGNTTFRAVTSLAEALEIQEAKFAAKKKDREAKLDAEIAKRKAARLAKLRQAVAA